MNDKPIKFDAQSIKTDQISKEDESSLLDDDLLDSKDKYLPVNINSVTLRKAKKNTKVYKIFWASLASLIVVGAGYEAWQLIQSMFSINSILGWAVTGLAGFTVFAGFFSFVRGRIKGRRLTRRIGVRHDLGLLNQGDTYGKAQNLINEINDEMNKEVDLSSAIAHFEQSKDQSHNDAELLTLYSDQVLSGVDKLALEVVSKHASKSAAMVALSSLAAVDMALVAWRSSKMLQEVSRIYGCPQNVFGRLGLTKKVATNLMLAGASELVADAGVELLGKGLAATISGKVAQGIGVGILNSRLGIQTMMLCRPMEFTPENKPKLGQLRKLITAKVMMMIGLKSKSKDDNLKLGDSDD